MRIRVSQFRRLSSIDELLVRSEIDHGLVKMGDALTCHDLGNRQDVDSHFNAIRFCAGGNPEVAGVMTCERLRTLRAAEDTARHDDLAVARTFIKQLEHEYILHAIDPTRIVPRSSSGRTFRSDLSGPFLDFKIVESALHVFEQ